MVITRHIRALSMATGGRVCRVMAAYKARNPRIRTRVFSLSQPRIFRVLNEELPGMGPGELDAAIRDDACFPGDLGYESREASGRFS